MIYQTIYNIIRYNKYKICNKHQRKIQSEFSMVVDINKKKHTI